MFTGIVEEIGRVKSILRKNGSYEITIECEKVLAGTKLGDSIATNGICLTATEIGSNFFKADVMPESVRNTSISEIKAKDTVNLERAMPVGGRFDGHIVQGHIDGVGKIANIIESGGNVEYLIEADSEIISQVVYKGSIALDGISLTVSGVEEKTFKVSIIPTTIRETALSSKCKGSLVNIETDIVGRYIRKFLEPLSPSLNTGSNKEESKISLEFLAENGF